MKKVIIFLISVFFLTQNSSAQMIEVVDANAYCNNPKKYNGRMITVKNVILKSTTANATPSPVMTPGAPKPSNTCTPPRGFKYLNIEFPNPTYDGCFVIAQNLTGNLISGRDQRVTITFKSDANLYNTISNLQLQP